MEAKISEYRRRKRREAMMEAVKNSLKEVLSWQSNATTANVGMERLQDEDDLESILSEDSIDETACPSTFYARTIGLLYFLLWLTLYIIAIQIEFGSVYFVISTLAFICLNTRSGRKNTEEVSAYSVFNPNCHSIAGTLTAEQFEQEIRYGPLSVK
ncbi:PREDICTED: SAYSvFN domain-containing protein 1 isoform X2 [Ceratosolen solmsi marchali]|uniref:SAYSvFN domain-containing protein 1 isoform X2 n=1 Tax=Ceratosolen solmsi marchali TaxID=326594 RepID=A0AAJ7DW88_9HYME|nr:PREDICTED: SAYSvFN domain-containing protein 1 isoform X2 [Ceratosolen solmsi marchali]